MGGVPRFTENLGVTYPVGVEQTSNYPAFNRNFRGPNPFPSTSSSIATEPPYISLVSTIRRRSLR